MGTKDKAKLPNSSPEVGTVPRFSPRVLVSSPREIRVCPLCAYFIWTLNKLFPYFPPKNLRNVLDHSHDSEATCPWQDWAGERQCHVQNHPGSQADLPSFALSGYRCQEFVTSTSEVRKLTLHLTIWGTSPPDWCGREVTSPTFIALHDHKGQGGLALRTPLLGWKPC